MPRYNKQYDFETGLGQVRPFFDALGFSTVVPAPYRDKEGTCYSARFVRAPRSVEFTHLYSLVPSFTRSASFPLSTPITRRRSALFLSFLPSRMTPSRATRHGYTTCSRYFLLSLQDRSGILSPSLLDTWNSSGSRMRTTCATATITQPRNRVSKRKLGSFSSRDATGRLFCSNPRYGFLSFFQRRSDSSLPSLENANELDRDA